jgi:hypothetical protein
MLLSALLNARILAELKLPPKRGKSMNLQVHPRVHLRVHPKVASHTNTKKEKLIRVPCVPHKEYTAGVGRSSNRKGHYPREEREKGCQAALCRRRSPEPHPERLSPHSFPPTRIHLPEECPALACGAAPEKRVHRRVGKVLERDRAEGVLCGESVSK